MYRYRVAVVRGGCGWPLSPFIVDMRDTSCVCVFVCVCVCVFLCLCVCVCECVVAGKVGGLLL